MRTASGLVRKSFYIFDMCRLTIRQSGTRGYGQRPPRVWLSYWRCGVPPCWHPVARTSACLQVISSAPIRGYRAKAIECHLLLATLLHARMRHCKCSIREIILNDQNVSTDNPTIRHAGVRTETPPRIYSQDAACRLTGTPLHALVA